ncbi:HNH endonuclease [Mycolicibacterium sp. P9-22]|uniref:HNH endonuclease n=1 Tax=Mycolicibacterium sp. P9-22 TaxID=2024613 RepID=UPI0011EEEDEF|nr:HNH endonuclease [Mycolicibacterium sp. P9-22]
MFDGLPDPATCGDITPEAMVDAIAAFHRAEATMVARKWAFIARLLAHHKDQAADEEKTWAHDEWSAVRDQVGPALRLSPRRASGQMRLAEGLTTRLPKVAALLESGAINTRVAETIVYRTELLLPSVQATVDAEIAKQAGDYTLLSEEALDLALDAIIEVHDPDACRRYRDAAKGCDVGFGKRDDVTGTSSVYGRISAADAELGARVLNALAGTVCKNDPRSKGELRAAAQGAVYRGQDRLPCHCGDPQCQAASLPSPVPSAVIHVLAEHAALEAVLAQVELLRQGRFGTPDVAPPTVDRDAVIREADAAEAARAATAPELPPWEGQPESQPDDDDEPPWATGSSPQPPTGPIDPDPDSAGAAAVPEAETHRDNPNNAPPQQDWGQMPAAHTRPRPAVTLGGAIIPLGLLAELLRDGATIVALPIPWKEPAAAYKFTRSAREFIQCRDLLCRFPGCNRKAEYADIDHTHPHGDCGATHPSNGKALCREHHLAKTFRGWHDQQLPNGEIHWTAPTGHRYVTAPTTRLLFPGWDPTTATLPPPIRGRRHKPAPCLAMPTRSRTREQDREQRIKAERDYNAVQRALDKPRRPPPR